MSVYVTYWVLCIGRPFCVFRIAYCGYCEYACVLRIAYSVSDGGLCCVLRIVCCVSVVCIVELWAGLRIAYSVSVFRIVDPWASLRIAYCVSVFRIVDLWTGLRIPYSVSVVRIGPVSGPAATGVGSAYCVLRIRLSVFCIVDP